jgi:predicted transcriptional regulator
MNEEQKAELKDEILRLLASRKQDDYLDISRIFKELNSTFDACYVAIGQLENEGNFVETREHSIEIYPKDKSVWITPGGRNFIKDDSYLSSLRFSRNAQRRYTIRKALIIVIPIGIAIVSIIINFIFGWIKYNKDDIIESQENEINNLHHQLDSIKKIPAEIIYLKDSI